MHSSTVQLVGILIVPLRHSILVFVSAAFSILVVSYVVAVLDDVTTVGEAGKVVDGVSIGCRCSDSGSGSASG
jgi:hypothetical protein